MDDSFTFYKFDKNNAQRIIISTSIIDKTHKDLNNFPFFLIIIVFNLLIQPVYSQYKKTLPDILHENSGMVFLGDTIAWVNDSGNPAALILTDHKGIYLNTLPLATQNIDWEEMSADDHGNIYIGDLGNNMLNRYEFKIYKLNPNFQLIDSILFSYPENFSRPKTFDCEAFCHFDGKLYLFTKGIDPNHAFQMCTFSIDDKSGIVQPLKTDCTDILRPYFVTGAAISPDRKTLALLSYRFHWVAGILPDTDSRIYLFNLSEGMENIWKHPILYYTVPTFFTTRQYESIDYDSNGDLWIASEKTAFLRPQLRKVKLPARLKSFRR